MPIFTNTLETEPFTEGWNAVEEKLGFEQTEEPVFTQLTQLEYFGINELFAEFSKQLGEINSTIKRIHQKYEKFSEDVNLGK
jgi:hypothetical protein